MKIAITGGTGFIGRHLARRLVEDGHEVVLIARGVDERDETIRRLRGVTLVAAGVGDEDKLASAFQGCDGIAHCAGINREIGEQTYRRIHVEGTRNVVRAAVRAGVKKVLLLSFLRARPDCGSGYHESKWEAEEIVRSSGLDHTVIKAGIVYGKGDHMLDHLSHALHTFPVFALIGEDRAVRPVAVQDLVKILGAALTAGALSKKTVAVTGPEEMPFSEVVRRVGRVIHKQPRMFRLWVFVHRVLAWCFERVMVVPLIALSQVRMLAEGLVVPAPECDPLPQALVPRLVLDDARIRQGLPPAGPFEARDLRCLGRA